MSTDARAQKLWPICEPGEDQLPVIWLERFESAGMAVIDRDDVVIVRRLAGCDVIEEFGECPSCGSAPCGPHPAQMICVAHEEPAETCPEFLRVSAVLAGRDR